MVQAENQLPKVIYRLQGHLRTLGHFCLNAGNQIIKSDITKKPVTQRATGLFMV